jgi:hypothetical protein
MSTAPQTSASPPPEDVFDIQELDTADGLQSSNRLLPQAKSSKVMLLLISGAGALAAVIAGLILAVASGTLSPRPDDPDTK